MLGYKSFSVVLSFKVAELIKKDRDPKPDEDLKELKPVQEVMMMETEKAVNMGDEEELDFEDS